jgi:hypothetical protein
MNEFLPLMVLIAFTVTVTALLIAGVIHLAVAADRSGRGEPGHARPKGPRARRAAHIHS